MSLTVFAAQEVAGKCFLSEALLWVAVNRFPLAYEIVSEECDAREYEENYEGPEPFIPDESPFSAEECNYAGLSPNPEREDFETGYFHPDPEKIKKDLEYAKSRPIGDPSQSVFHDQKWLDAMEKSLVESEQFHARQTAWNADYEDFIDVHKSRLYLALKEGKIRAYGRQLPNTTYVESMDDLEDTSWKAFYDSRWEIIPPDFWVSDRILWKECWAENRRTTFSLILIEFAMLMNLFPPTKVPVEGVKRVGDVLILDTDSNVKMPKSGRRGRPANDWDKFHVEVAKRLKDGDLPNKQEAFIADMQDWCRTHWKKEVARSTLLQKLKPYYDEFIRGPEKLGR